MSNWDYIDEVDILPKLPPNFDELRESKKWQERKEALEVLLKLLTDNERLSTKVSYAELIGNLQTILAKDANINCQALAAKCIGKFASGLRSKFAGFATPLLPVIFEKMKEKKPTLREPLVECSNEVGRTMPSLEASLEDIVAALAKPNPQIKQQTVLFVGRQLDLLAPAKQPKALIKAIVPIMGKLTGDADSDVREAATTALGAVSRLIGEKNVKSLLGDVGADDAKMKKVAEAAEKSAQIFAEEQAKNAPPAPPAATTSTSSPAPKSAGKSPAAAAAASQEPVEADPWDFLDAFDVCEKLPDGFDTNIESKKWQERKEALEGLLALMTANPKLEPKANYGGLVEKLQKILAKDANINVAALAANCLTGLANGLRVKFSQFAISVAPTIFDKFKEKKPTLRDPLVLCIDAVLATTNLENLAEIIVEALAKPNPSIKTQTDLFLQRSFMKLNSQTMPKKSLKTFIPLLIKHSGDSDSEVRDACYAAMGAMMRAIGEKPALSLLADIATDNIKMGKIKEYHQKALEEAGPAEIAAMVQSIHKSDAPVATSTPKPKSAPARKVVEEPEEENLEEEPEDEPLKLPAGGPRKEEKKKVSPRENAENEPPAPPPKQELLLAENNEKAQRISDERKLKLVKWNFQTPTDEHIAQLQQLLSQQAKVSLMSQLFHKDFKQHLSALDSLLKLADIAPNVILSNSDLLLKWCTLRFFETNPAALIKVLEFSRVIVTLIQDTDTQMTQEEVASFVPYLLLKTGEPKENMRLAVRNIIDILSNIVGPLKLTPMLIDGLKSKNARQRTECLLVIESYINSAGIIPLKSLNIEKTVAVFVGDKDMNVRNAAINVLVACYRFEGEQMWKLAGRMADKDRSLVEERIKRSGAKPGSGVPSGETSRPGGGPKIVVPQQGTVVRPRSRTRDRGAENDYNSTFTRNDDEEVQQQQHVPRSTSRYALREDDISGAFSKLANNSILQPIASAPTSRWGNSQQNHQPMKRTNSSSSISSIDTSDQIQRSINNISSSLSDVAQDALYQVTYVLNQPEQRHLVDRQADLVFRACAAQFDIMHEEFRADRDISGKMEACTQMLFILLGGVDQDSSLEPLVATIETIRSIMISVLRCIIGIGSTEIGYAMARNLNRLIMRLIYRVELSNLLCGWVSAMTESFRKYNDVTTLVSKLASKWCDELEKRRTQLRASDVVENFNQFYICTLVEQKLSIDNEYVLMMDNTLERVIIQQGEYVMDAARRLPTPHMHLTSLINKVLQQMREQGIQPILPGTLEDTSALNEDETIIIRNEATVLVDNIIRDTSNAQKYVEQLKKIIESDQKLKIEYLEYTKKHVLGEMVRELVESYRPNYGSRLSTAGMAPLNVLKTISLMGECEEAPQQRQPPPQQMNFETPSRREPAAAAQTIRRPKRTTMSREQLASIKQQLDRVKQQ
ncbi:unnamed protein product [Caenorhabditis angaria]|uniref:TOG domain-containing protein n=1 Tax=Caenorhabditis angaria TaxID=860376 RepID=A0A9P1I4B6_9PELO|nr:unnamed protein product [Caenorhabditis angaria]